MIYDIESTDIKASVAVSRVIWALLNAIFSGDEEDDLLSFQDKELLETKSELHQLKGTLTHTQHKLHQIEAELNHTEMEYALASKTLEQYKAETAQLETALAESKAKLAISNAKNKEIKQILKKSAQKPDESDYKKGLRKIAQNV